MTESIVRLNVGGKHFDTTKLTLMGSPFFARLLDGTMSEPTLDVDGRIFVDYEPDGFKLVLTFLRTRVSNLKPSCRERGAFDYFGVTHPHHHPIDLCGEKRKRVSAENLPGYEELVKNMKNVATATADLGRDFMTLSYRVPRESEKGWWDIMRPQSTESALSEIELLDDIEKKILIDGFAVLHKVVYFNFGDLGAIVVKIELRRK